MFLALLNTTTGLHNQQINFAAYFCRIYSILQKLNNKVCAYLIYIVSAYLQSFVHGIYTDFTIKYDNMQNVFQLNIDALKLNILLLLITLVMVYDFRMLRERAKNAENETRTVFYFSIDSVCLTAFYFAVHPIIKMENIFVFVSSTRCIHFNIMGMIQSEHIVANSYRVFDFICVLGVFVRYYLLLVQ